ncbi:MAG: phosphatidylserine decarboxylase [Oceanospirillaceae bacterium]|jgi:phosphatidylserine decarboxylase|nr:phosphatidylserine decarboxylase [Oceanospirillaceae bacterium]MBT6077767.1 phosphatidylserine decarboxylase [Oceanospirillaceae bacterium]
MGDRLFVVMQYLLPQHLISRIVGMLAASSVPIIKDTFINVFVKRFKVDMSEAEQQNTSEFDSFNDFFTRSLKADARMIDNNPTHLACPVDGAISQLGSISGEKLFQAKGHDFDLTTLLGGNADLAQPFIDGEFATVYLAPKDYHRIHMPCDGTLTHMVHVPGQLFSVNQATAAAVPGLFARNERVVTIFETEFGPMAMVLVGAMIVASVETTWAGLVCPKGKAVSHFNYTAQQPIEFKKGDEMGRFKLGSTVIVCLPKGVSQWPTELTAGTTTRLGQMFAELV